MRKTDFNKLKKGDRVIVSGKYDDKEFDHEKGTIADDDYICGGHLIMFDTWSKGHGDGSCWCFGDDGVRTFNITVIPEAPKATPATPKKRPHGKQEYKGNGKHAWETVTGSTVRLRVPGGWLYGKSRYGDNVLAQTTFVPVPEAVGYVV